MASIGKTMNWVGRDDPSLERNTTIVTRAAERASLAPPRVPPGWRAVPARASPLPARRGLCRLLWRLPVDRAGRIAAPPLRAVCCGLGMPAAQHGRALAAPWAHPGT